MWCGNFNSPQFAHSPKALGLKAWWERRWLRRDLEIFFFGTAIAKLPKSRKTSSLEGIRDAVSIVISSNEQEITIKVLKLFEMQFIIPRFAASSVFQKD